MIIIFNIYVSCLLLNAIEAQCCMNSHKLNMAKSNECPSSYETYIDIIKPSGVKCVIWFFFQKFNASWTVGKNL